VIGVITSPTGAVIRDILHRLSDRFPARAVGRCGSGGRFAESRAASRFNAFDAGGACRVRI